LSMANCCVMNATGKSPRSVLNRRITIQCTGVAGRAEI
jgi:hypothetical protein